jgi:hypothetical protein
VVEDEVSDTVDVPIGVEESIAEVGVVEREEVGARPEDESVGGSVMISVVGEGVSVFVVARRDDVVVVSGEGGSEVAIGGSGVVSVGVGEIFEVDSGLEGVVGGEAEDGPVPESVVSVEGRVGVPVGGAVVAVSSEAGGGVAVGVAVFGSVVEGSSVTVGSGVGVEDASSGGSGVEVDVGSFEDDVSNGVDDEDMKEGRKRGFH